MRRRSIRPSRDDDVAAIAAIYGHHVLHGVASFEEVPPPAEEIGRRRGAILARGLPYLVAERGRAGRRLLLCRAVPAAHRLSLHARGFDLYRRRPRSGAASAARCCSRCSARCAELGYRQMVAVIGGRETVASIRLHEALGFAHIGVLRGGRLQIRPLGRQRADAARARAGRLDPARLRRGLRTEEQHGRRHSPIPATIRSYHAHIYYDPATRPVAERLREAIGDGFTVELGRWHDEPVGPHPISMYQVAFAVAEFPRLVPWLMLNRGGLDVLVHPQTGECLRRPHGARDVARRASCRCASRCCAAAAAG